MSKQLATKELNLPVVEERPDYISKGNRGSEEVTHQDLVIPRLNIIQAMSPQRKKSTPEYIEGAEEGQIWNTVTRELLGTSVNLITVHMVPEWIIWKDREQGGGFEGSYPTKSQGEIALRQLEDMDSYALHDHHTNFCILVDPSSTAEELVGEEVVVSFSGSKMKASRQLNSLCKMAQCDRFARLYTLSTFEDSNRKGDLYYNFKVEQKGFVPEAWFKRAEAMYEAIKAGEVRAGHDAGSDLENTQYDDSL